MSETRTPDVTEQLRAGKEKLRKQRRAMSLSEKLAQLIELQKIEVNRIRRRRELRPWERVWPDSSTWQGRSR